MNPQIAIHRMQYNIGAARELAKAGLLTVFMRGHYSGVIATYAREADTPEVTALNYQLQGELEQLVNNDRPAVNVAPPGPGRLFNPNDFFGRHQGVTLVLIAVLAVGVTAL